MVKTLDLPYVQLVSKSKNNFLQLTIIYSLNDCAGLVNAAAHKEAATAT